MKIHAEYNKYGYTVLQDGEPIYGAGNHPGDSCAILHADDPIRLGLPVIAKYAEATARGIAEERGAKFAGIEKISTTVGGRGKEPILPDCIGAAC